MKATVISSANESIKKVSNSLRDGNKEYTSISRVLKDIQRADMLKAGYGQVFEALGFSDVKKVKVTPAAFFASLEDEQWGITTNKAGQPIGEKWVGIWGMTQKKDAEGNKVTEIIDGVEVPVMIPVLRKVTAWTPTKLFKVYAQAMAIKAEKAAASK